MTEPRTLPHDPYITAVYDALTRRNTQPGTCWTDDTDGELTAVFHDWPDELVDEDTWPAGVYLTWDQSAGWALVETGDSRTVHPLDPAGMDGVFTDPRQVACSVENALRGRLVTGPIAIDGRRWDSGPSESAVAAWLAGRS